MISKAGFESAILIIITQSQRIFSRQANNHVKALDEHLSLAPYSTECIQAVNVTRCSPAAH